MKKISLLLLLTVLTMGLYAQKMKDTRWTTGEMTVYCSEDDGTNLRFELGFAHDGSTMYVKRVSTGVFEAKDPENANGMNKIKIVTYKCDRRGTVRVLYCQNEKGTFSHALVEVTNENDFGKTNFCELLEGTYSGSDGKKYIFSGNSLIINGVSNDYEPLICEMGYVNGFMYKGQKYCFKVSENGFNLYTTNTDDGEFEYEPEKLWVKLTIDQEKNQGRWPLLKGDIVMEKYAMYYTKKQIRIMRNEIYARHGYKFASADLTAHFSKMSWYHPVDDNSKVHLSDVETLNVSILKNMEALSEGYLPTSVEK
ncbi:MAG: YARHG domain-containing protein [Bacteroidales bacterium]|nr:YARHG domain-containing protein [Bacteroidales bacterium]